jgi:hypothetical protein
MLLMLKAKDLRLTGHETAAYLKMIRSEGKTLQACSVVAAEGLFRLSLS